MKALCWHGKGDVRYETVPDPTIQGPRDAIIKVTACAIWDRTCISSMGSSLRCTAATYSAMKRWVKLSKSAQPIRHSMSETALSCRSRSHAVSASSVSEGTIPRANDQTRTRQRSPNSGDTRRRACSGTRICSVAIRVGRRSIYGFHSPMSARSKCHRT